MIDREAVAALRQRGEMFDLGRPEIAECRLLELQHKRRRQRPVGLEEVEALRKRAGIAEGRRRDIAEYADILVAHHQPPQHLHASQHHHVVDPPDQPGVLGGADEILGSEDLVLFVAQPRHRFVEAHLALRQAHHRLQINVDAVFLYRAPHRGQELRMAAGGCAVAGDGLAGDSVGSRHRGREHGAVVPGRGRQFLLRATFRFGGRRRGRSGGRARGQHFLVGLDRCRELFHQGAEFVDLADHGLNPVDAGGIG